METYRQMTERHQREYDEFSKEECFYAFSQEQFDKGLAQIVRRKGIEEHDVVRFGMSGCFTTKQAAPRLRELFIRQGEEKREAMRNGEWAEAAFLHEMGNREYLINWEGDYDVVSCFYPCEYGENKDADDYLREANAPVEVRAAYMRARREHYRLAEENGWY